MSFAKGGMICEIDIYGNTYDAVPFNFLSCQVMFTRKQLDKIKADLITSLSLSSASGSFTSYLYPEAAPLQLMEIEWENRGR